MAGTLPAGRSALERDQVLATFCDGYGRWTLLPDAGEVVLDGLQIYGRDRLVMEMLPSPKCYPSPNCELDEGRALRRACACFALPCQ
jgi:hypothetical protein